MGGNVKGTKRFFALFDTRAESSNYIYGYFLSTLKQQSGYFLYAIRAANVVGDTDRATAET